jgi:hypothetical protein
VNIAQICRGEDVRHWRRFQRRTPRARAIRFVGTAVGILAMWSAIIWIL